MATLESTIERFYERLSQKIEVRGLKEVFGTRMVGVSPDQDDWINVRGVIETSYLTQIHRTFYLGGRERVSLGIPEFDQEEDIVSFDKWEPYTKRIRGSTLIQEKTDEELSKRIRDWAVSLKRDAPKPFISEVRGDDSKWLSKKYALKKLGL